jgi:chemotaxis protein methyltransferase CheR
VTSPVQRFAALIREETGNVVPAERHPFLAEVAERRVRATGQPDVDAYLLALAARLLPGEWDRLVSLVTIKESYFFRAPQQFDAILRQVLPGLVQARAEVRRLRLWSAACARGEEPGTLALLLAGERALAGWDWRVLATDVDEEAIEGARRGLYGERALAQVPADLRERYFHRRGKLFELSAALRERIDYRLINLAHPPYALAPGGFDLVLLRNVLIYFRRPLQRWAVGHVARTLAPEGMLFLGASETLWQIQEDLEAVDLGTCFGYRHRQAGEAAEKAAAGRAKARPATGEVDRLGKPAAGKTGKAVPAPKLATDAAVRAARDARDELGRSTLTGNPPSVIPRQSGRVIAPVDEPLAPAPAAAHPADTAGALQDRLLRAARLLAGNEVAESARLLAEILEADPSEPAAHALEGFHHDLGGRPDEALAAYRAALYLEPRLFQARLLLADCLLRRGRRDQAEHQYREVLATLDGGRERALTALEDLPLPDPERARRRCRQALHVR